MDDLLRLAGVSLVGFVTAIAVFRTSVAQINAKLDAHVESTRTNREHDKELLDIALEDMRKEIERQYDQTAETHRRIERRQDVTLEVLAAIARKAGVTHRALGADALAHFLGEDNDQRGPNTGT